LKLAQIHPDDVIEARIKGRSVMGRVTEVNDGVVYFRPISPAAGWRHASAREIVAHWRKTGRRHNGAEDEPSPKEQLSLRVSS
jgi:hypothetical protein